MSALTTLTALLPEYGPWLLFLLAVLETCFVTGLVVPSGLATSLATALAVQGELPLLPFLLAALAGGWVGDSLGFWIGHAWGEHVLEGRGRMSRALAERRPRMERFFGRHPVYSVTLARLVSFVRTLMPMTAGMSGLSYARYLPYEAAGLVGWLGIYVLIGVVGGESWEALARIVGVGGAALFAGVTAVGWVVLRRQAARRRAARMPVEPATAATGGAGAGGTPNAEEDGC